MTDEKTYRYEAPVSDLPEDGKITYAVTTQPGGGAIVSASVGGASSTIQYPSAESAALHMCAVSIQHESKWYTLSWSLADGYAFCECQSTGENWTLPPSQDAV